MPSPSGDRVYFNNIIKLIIIIIIINHYHKGLSARGFLPTAGFIGLAEPSLIPCVSVSPMKVDRYKATKKDFVL